MKNKIPKTISQYMKAIGSKGGSVKSQAKTDAARKNSLISAAKRKEKSDVQKD